MAGLTLSGIVKRYGNAPLTLKGIDLTIENGEFLVLVGPSGCGKSTLLRIIAGLESITEGELRIGDRVVNTVAPKDRDIAMVFQSYALYPHMTVRRNMSFGLEVRKTPRDEITRLVNDASRLLGLDDQLDKLPKMLSGGQRQRVAMGRAIVRRPEVFLFDEPLSNLDAALRSQMRIEIRQLHSTLATTTVYVTHDQIEAMTLADRIAVLDQGILQQVGTPAELFGTPANRFVAGFIGSPAMNFMEVTLSQSDRGARLMFDDRERGIAGIDKSISGKVELGIRPQHLSVDANGAGIMQGSVKVVETLGWESHVHLDVAGYPFLASVEAEQAHGLVPGQEVGVRVAPGALHLFAAESGEALAHGVDFEVEAGEEAATA